MLLINAFIYLGIFAAGISGALVGIQKQMDLFGVMSLCVATSIGGGIIRDILIGSLPPMALVDPTYFFVSLSAGLLTWVFYPRIGQFQNLLMVSDAVGLGVFTAAGASAALHHMDKPFLIVSMGLITGIGGGVIRDVFAKEIPYVFRKEIYAVASILGALAYILASRYVPDVLALYICLIITFTIRVCSVVRKVNFPVYPTATPTKKQTH